jgi:hypothetical protein
MRDAVLVCCGGAWRTVLNCLRKSAGRLRLGGSRYGIFGYRRRLVLFHVFFRLILSVRVTVRCGRCRLACLPCPTEETRPLAPFAQEPADSLVRNSKEIFLRVSVGLDEMQAAVLGRSEDLLARHEMASKLYRVRLAITETIAEMDTHNFLTALLSNL